MSSDPRRLFPEGGYRINETITSAAGLSVPFIGTALGAAMVFFLKKGISPVFQKILLGFASGVMIAASVWSLLIPSIEMTASRGGIPWLPPTAGFLCGMGFLSFLDAVTPRICDSGSECGRFGKNPMLLLAVTLHNVPEGMAVGVVLAGMLNPDSAITAAEALMLSVGIAVQNLPEGAIISMPLVGSGTKKSRAFFLGVLSGAVEPLGAVLTLLLTALITPVLPYILAFAAGAMIYVVVEELVPEFHNGGKGAAGTIGVAAGFALMMLLDVALG